MTQVFYVAPIRLGNGDGLSDTNAALYTDLSDPTTEIARKVRGKLAGTNVVVRFRSGTYDQLLLIKDYGQPCERTPNYMLTLTGEYTEEHRREWSAFETNHRTNCTRSIEGDIVDDYNSMTSSYSEITDYYNHHRSFWVRQGTLQVMNCYNVSIKHFNFTQQKSGVGEALLVQDSKNVFVMCCHFKDITDGDVAGATELIGECYLVNYYKCSFVRIGTNFGTHMMYHAGGSRRCGANACYFEDCSGTYVKLRNYINTFTLYKCDFVTTEQWPPGNPSRCDFVHMSVINHFDNRNEVFGNDLRVFECAFIYRGPELPLSHSSEIEPRIPPIGLLWIAHSGHNPVRDEVERHHLLTIREAQLLDEGTPAEKKRILLNNFYINADQIEFTGTRVFGFYDMYFLGSGPGPYEIPDVWDGLANIANAINRSVSRSFSAVERATWKYNSGWWGAPQGDRSRLEPYVKQIEQKGT